MKLKTTKLIVAFSIISSGCFLMPSCKDHVDAQIQAKPNYSEGSFRDGVEISFPSIQSFDSIAANLQSVDPDLYNFQMWTTRDGLYCYVEQNTTNLVNDKTNNWEETHTEFEIWNGDFGYGWGGTYVALFLDGTMYLNNTINVRSYYYYVEYETVDETTHIEYYLYIDFDNNKNSAEPPYAYVKPYQCMPNEEDNAINSQKVIRDGRSLITGSEKSFQVHETIDAFMTT